MTTGVNQGQRAGAGENEALFRELNERLKGKKEDASIWVAPSQWVCECETETCAERVELSPEKYEQVRADPTHFIVAPDEEHVSPDVERVIEKSDRYWVVEKVGEAAETAEQTDPRDP